MAAVDVEHVGEAVLQHSSDGVVVGQVVVLPEVPVLVEVDGVAVGGEHMEVDGLAVVLRRCGDVLLQAVQQQGAWGWAESTLTHSPGNTLRTDLKSNEWNDVQNYDDPTHGSCIIYI